MKDKVNRKMGLMGLILVAAGCGPDARDAKVAGLEARVALLETNLAEVANATARKTQAEREDLFRKIGEQEGRGEITHERAQYLRKVLAGEVKMYRLPDGTLTTNSTN